MGVYGVYKGVRENLNTSRCKWEYMGYTRVFGGYLEGVWGNNMNLAHLLSTVCVDQMRNHVIAWQHLHVTQVNGSDIGKLANF